MADATRQLADLIATAADAAADARSHAYAPYSNFTMGAAAVSADGEVVDGVLVENVSLGLAMCAERVALFAAVTRQVRAADEGFNRWLTEFDFDAARGNFAYRTGDDCTAFDA